VTVQEEEEEEETSCATLNKCRQCYALNKQRINQTRSTVRKNVTLWRVHETTVAKKKQ